MEIKRFFVSKDDIKGETLLVKGEEFYHLTKVLRHKVGYVIICCCGDGKDYYCTLTKINKDCAEARIDEIKDNTAGANSNLHLFQAVIKSAKLDIVVQKAVELGVKKITLFYSNNTNEKDINIDRLNKICKEASKQCGRSDLVRIGEVLDFDDMLEEARKEDYVIMPYEYEDKVNFSSLNFPKGSYALIVGSEGGFQKYEVEKAKNIGAKSVSLGNRILRAETASIIASSLVMFMLGEFDK